MSRVSRAIIVVALPLVVAASLVYYLHDNKGSAVWDQQTTQFSNAEIANKILKHAQANKDLVDPSNISGVIGIALKDRDVRSILLILRNPGRLKSDAELVQAIARVLSEKADEGDPLAMVGLGLLKKEGLLNGKRDPKGALENFERAAARGELSGLLEAAKLLMDGTATPPNFSRAEEYVDQAIELGSSEGLFLRGIIKLSSASIELGLVDLGRGAEMGNADAARLLSRLYAEGRYVETDLARAEFWRTRAIQLGSSQAEVDVAHALLNNEDAILSVDEAKIAIDHLVSASSQDDAQAMFDLANLAVQAGEMTRSEYARTKQNALDAFDNGLPSAAFLLATLALIDGEQGESASAEWVEKGSRLDDWRSRMAEAMMEKGIPARNAIAAAASSTLADYLAYKTPVIPDKSGSAVPLVIQAVTPTLPPELQTLGVKGKVVAEILVSSNGVPESIQIVSSTHQLLEEPVRVAVSQWRFKPGSRSGVSIPMKLRIPISFQTATK